MGLGTRTYGIGKAKLALGAAPFLITLWATLFAVCFVSLGPRLAFVIGFVLAVTFLVAIHFMCLFTKHALTQRKPSGRYPIGRIVEVVAAWAGLVFHVAIVALIPFQRMLVSTRHEWEALIVLFRDAW